MAVSYMYNAVSETLDVSMTNSDNSVAFEFDTYGADTDGDGTVDKYGIFGRMYISGTPETGAFALSRINVAVTNPATAANNIASFGIAPDGSGFNLSSFVLEGNGTTASGFFRCQVGNNSLPSVGINLTDVDTVSLTRAEEIRVDGTFSNDTGDAKVSVAPELNNAETQVFLGTNRPLAADYIQIEDTKSISIFNGITASKEVILRSAATLDLPYDIAAGSRLVLDGTGGVFQRTSSTMTAPVLEVVSRTGQTAGQSAGNIELGSPNNDFDNVRIQSLTTGKVGIRDIDDLEIDGYGILATTGDVVIDAGGALLFNSQVKADSLTARSNHSIHSTAQGSMTIGTGGLSLSAAKTADEETLPTGDILLEGHVSITGGATADNVLRAAGTTTIAGGFYSSGVSKTWIESDGGLVISSPVQVGGSNLTLVSSKGGITILDAPGNEAVPYTIRAADILSLDAAEDISIGGSLRAGAVTVQGDSQITITSTGKLIADTTNGGSGAITIAGASKLLHQGEIDAGGAASVSIVGDAILLGKVTAKSDLDVITSEGSVDVQGRITTTAATNADGILLRAVSGSISTSGDGVLDAGAGQIKLEAQQNIEIGANIDTLGAVGIDTRLGQFALDALLRSAGIDGSATPALVRISAGNGIEQREFGRFVVQQLDLTNTGLTDPLTPTNVDVTGSNNQISAISVANLSADGTISIANRGNTTVGFEGAVNTGLTTKGGSIVVNVEGSLYVIGTVLAPLGSAPADITLSATEAVGFRTTTANDTSLSPFVHASNAVKVSAASNITLRGELIADTGDIAIASSDGAVDLRANLHAVEESISITAHSGVSQSGNGLASITLTASGSNYTAASATIAGPISGGGVAATAQVNTKRETFYRETVDPVTKLVTRTPFFVTTLTGITIIDPGSGYAPGEQPKVTITGDGQGATAVAFAETFSSQNLVAGKNVAINAGSTVTLVSAVRADNGDVSVSSIDGGLSLDVESLFINAPKGQVTLSATGGGAGIRNIAAAGDIKVDVRRDLVLLDDITSASGDISLRSAVGNLDLATSRADVAITAGEGKITLVSAAGTVTTPKVLDGFAGVEVSSYDDLRLKNVITSKSGPISLESRAGDVYLDAIVSAEGDALTIKAFSALRNASVGGITNVVVVNAGVNYSGLTTVEFAAPNSLIGDPVKAEQAKARGRAIVDNGRLVGIEILSGGSGYLPGEKVAITITDAATNGAVGAGAEAFAIAEPTQSLFARGDLKVSTGSGLTLFGNVESVAGNLEFSSTLGDVDLSGDATRVRAAGGSVTVAAEAGKVLLRHLSADENIAVSASKDVVFSGSIDSTAGDIALSTLHGNLVLDSQAGSIVAMGEGKGITLTSVAGAITTPKVLEARGDITVTSLSTLTLNRSIVSKDGAIDLKSTAGDVALNAIVSAETKGVTLEAFANIKSFSGGVTRIEVINGGSGYSESATQVVILSPGETFDPVTGAITQAQGVVNQRSDFRRAVGRAVLNETGKVIAVEIVDAGRGYLTTDAVTAVVRDTRAFPAGSGAQLLVYVDPSPQTLSGLADVSVKAGADIELVGLVRSYEGDVTIESTSGRVDLDGASVVLQAMAGSVTVTALAGDALLRRITADGNVDVNAKLGVSLAGAIDSTAGAVTLTTTHGDLMLSPSDGSIVAMGEGKGITLTSVAGEITTPKVLEARGDITVTSLSTLTLNRSIVSKDGAIDLKSTAGDVEFNAIVSAEKNSVSLEAFANIKSFSGGVTRIEVVNGGSGYSENATQVVILSPGETVNPVTGEITQAQGVVNQRSDFRRAVGRAVLNETGKVIAVEIVDAGRGYLTTDAVTAVVRDTRALPTGSGAQLLVYVDPSPQTLSGLADVSVKAGAGIELVGLVRSYEGDIAIESTSGRVDLDGIDAVLQAMKGDVTVAALAGDALLRRITADGNVDVNAKLGVSLAGAIDSTTGAVTLATTHGDLTLSPSDGSIVAMAGGITLTSVAGEITTPNVLEARGDITVTSLSTLMLNRSIVSKDGAIDLKSTAGDVEFNAIVSAETKGVTLEAFANIKSFSGGVTRIQVVNGGAGYAENATQVVILSPGETIDPTTGAITQAQGVVNQRSDFRRAVARAVLNETGKVIAVEIVDAGRGYLTTDAVTAVVRDTRAFQTGSGAQLLVYVDPSPQTLSGLADVSVKAGADIELVGLVRSYEGDVTIESTSGRVDLDGASVVLQAVDGAVRVAALAGEASIRQIRAQDDVDIDAKLGVTLLGTISADAGNIRISTTHGDVALNVTGAEVIATKGDVTLESLGGQVLTPQTLRAGADISVTSYATLQLNDTITSDSGDIALASSAGDVRLDAVIKATGGSISLAAHTAIESNAGGITKVTIVNGGSGYSPATTVAISAPKASDGYRARGRVVVDDFGKIVDLIIVDPGKGYLPGEQVQITFTDVLLGAGDTLGVGAEAIGFCELPFQNLSARSDITIEAGTDLTVLGVVRSDAGNISLTSRSGVIDLSGSEAVIQADAPTGIVAIDAVAGAVKMNQVLGGEIAVDAQLGISLSGAMTASTGDIALKTIHGDVNLDNVNAAGDGARVIARSGSIAVESVTGKVATPQILRAAGDISLTSLSTMELKNSIVADSGDITVVSEAGRVTLNAVVQATLGSVTIKANSDLADIGGGITKITLVNGGTSYSAGTTVVVAAPRNGGEAARVRPTIVDGRITGLEILYAGSGYAPGEVVILTGTQSFIDFPEGGGDIAGFGAEAIALCEQPAQGISAAGAITIETVDDLKMFGLLRAEGDGGISLLSKSGDIDLSRSSMLAQATKGAVVLAAPGGAAKINDLLAETSVSVTTEQTITVTGLVRAATESISLASTSGAIIMQGDGELHAVEGSVDLLAKRGQAALQKVYAGQNISLESLGDVALTESVHAADGDLTIVSKGGIDNAARLETGGSISLSASSAVTSLGGGIVKIDLLSGGNNYEYAIVTVAGPASGGGRAATARATITDKVITAITIVDPGYGYASGEVVRVTIEGQPARVAANGTQIPGGAGARASATANQTSSSLIAGESIEIKGGSLVDVTNALRANGGSVTVNVSAGPLKLSEVLAAEDVSLTAARTISLGALLRSAGGDVTIESTGGGLDMRGTILAPAGSVDIVTAAQIVQRGGSVSRDKIFLLSGGRNYTYALVVISPPPGAGETALARAVITDPNPFDTNEGGYISDIVLLDGGWGYPSDSRVNVTIQGDGEGAVAVFGTDMVSSSIDARDNVTIRSGDTVTLVSTVRSASGDVGILTTLGDVSIQSITAGGAVDVTSNRGVVTLVSVSGQQDIGVNADQGLSITDSLNTVAGNISLETTNGDITFVKKLNFGDNYLVDDAATAIEPEAVISTKMGGISMTAHNGAIVSPYVINAALDVNLTSLVGMELTNQITSQLGDINVESTSSLVRVRSNMVAEAGSINIEAQTSLQQEYASGISKIELLSPGPMQRVPPAVTVTIAPPRNGGEAATAFAVIERRALDNQNNNNNNNGNPFNKVIEYEYFIGSIAIINPGRGYEVGENPVVTITGVDGATARAYGPTMVAMITAQKNINLLAGENITLVTKVHAVDGNVTVASKAGDLDLSANLLFISSKAGGIGINAYGGSVEVQRLAGYTDVTVNAMEGVNILRSVMSENGSIGIVSTNNAANVRQLNANKNVTVSGFKTSTLVGEIVGATGNVTATSTAGGLRVNANIVAGRDVSLSAQTFVEQLDRTGIEALEIVSEGSVRQVTLTPVPPTVTVTIAAPAAGGRAATARAILGKRFLGNDPQGTNPIWEYFIDKVEIIDAGAGYAIGESPIVTLAGMPGAVVRGIGPTNLRNITARNNLSIHADDDIKLLYRMVASKGNMTISSDTGDIDLSSKLLRMSVPVGALSISTDTGSISLPTVSPAINVAGNISLRSFAPLTVNQQLTTTKGNVSLASTGGSVVLNAPVFAAYNDSAVDWSKAPSFTDFLNKTPGYFDFLNKTTGRIDISAKTGITQNSGFVKAAELSLVNMDASPIVLSSQQNDVDRFAAKNLGAVSYTDADEFRVGLRTSGTMGVELTGSSVNLASVAPQSVIRVVAGISARALVINAGLLGGDSIGTVEFVTTSKTDSTSTAFAGRLRDMVGLASANRGTYVVDGATIAQPMRMVFDEAGYVIDEISLAQALPAFTRPVVFDGSRVRPEVTTDRLGIRGGAAATGITLGARSSGSTITDTALYGFTKGSAVVVESARNTIIDTFFGIKADGVTTSTNLVGVNITGPAAVLNRIGSGVLDIYTTSRLGDGPNRFAGNTDAAILIQRESARNLVFGNLIGGKAIQNVTGVAGLRANGDGIRIDNSIGNVIGSSGQLAVNQVASDLQRTASNFIQGNNGNGIFIRNALGGTTETGLNRIQNNVVTDNLSHGVNVAASKGVRIGGTTEFDANVFGKNTGSGVYLFNASGVDIVGNSIGVDVAAATALGNKRIGIEVAASSNGVKIDSNRIATNERSGIAITSRATNVEITNNVIGGSLNRIASIQVVDGGSGYTTAPTVIISAPIRGSDMPMSGEATTRQATATAIVSGGKVIGITLLDAGQGYSADEEVEVTFVGPSGEGATAKVIWASGGNREDGVLVTNAIGNRIGVGNVISRNMKSGVSIIAANAKTLAAGNRIVGSEIFANLNHGIQIGGSNRVTIGGSESEANRVYGNALDGIRIEAHAQSQFVPTSNVVSGNFIGTNEFSDVNPALGNGRNGIVISRGVSNIIANGNQVMNNRANGIEVRGGRFNVIGGEKTTAGNYIGFNEGSGIFVADQLTNSVTGTCVGVPTDTSRLTISGNEITQNCGNGVQVSGSKTYSIWIGHNMTGSKITGLANQIYGNGGLGVLIDAAQRVSVQGNEVYENVGGGLSLINGANGFAAAKPVFDSAVVDVARRSREQIIVSGRMAGVPLQQYAIDVYANEWWDEFNGTGGHQMRQHIGRQIVTADANGFVIFSFTVDGNVPLGDALTLTATTLLYSPGSTSPLSDPIWHQLPNQTTPTSPGTVPPSGSWPTSGSGSGSSTTGTATGTSGTIGSRPVPPSRG